VFAPGEALEFQRRDLTGALRAFEPLAGSADPMTRAGALLRIARIQSQLNQPRSALEAYDRLAALGTTLEEGLPAGLLGRYGRCLVLRDLNRREDLEREAAALDTALDAGTWRLTRAEYEFYRGQAGGWRTSKTDRDSAAVLRSRERLSAALTAAWEAWGAGLSALTPAAGSRLVDADGVAALLVWRSDGGRVAALIAGPHFVDARFVTPGNDLLTRFGARMALADPDPGASGARQSHDGTRRVQRAASETRLPWTVSVVDTDPGAETAAATARSRLAFAGLIALVLFVLGGSAFIVRAVNRELEVSRLQTEFVAAVSHEFRTPLTSIRQVSELLLEGRVPEARREEYYRMQHHDSERLHRLVESLLDFGRMESGAREYRFEAVDLTALVRTLASEFSIDAAAAGYTVDVDLQSDGVLVSADREALSRAIWNLLDNAVKYSPSHKVVWLATAVVDGRVEVSVRDRGVGVPVEDQRRIFDKFARGANAAGTGAKGTGLGLAMVKHIVDAHGGSVLMNSTPGAGSTFTLTLPLRAAADGES
jgi:signal transduction histidine kinase